MCVLIYTEVVHSSGLYSCCLLATLYTMKVGALVNECYDNNATITIITTVTITITIDAILITLKGNGTVTFVLV